MKAPKCDECQQPFKPNQHNQRWCGKACADKGRYKANRNPYKLRKRTITGRPCDRCGMDRGPNHSICQTCVKATRRDAYF